MSTVPEIRARIAVKARELRDLRKELRAARGEEPPKRRATIRKRPKGGTWKADRDECDVLMGRIVKVERDRCEVCGETRRSTFQWAHGFSRRFLAVRYDVDNGFCLCAGCHKRMTHDQISWTRWMIERLQQKRYDDLERRARLTTRFEPTLVLALRARAGELGVQSDEGWSEWKAARP